MEKTAKHSASVLAAFVLVTLWTLTARSAGGPVAPPVLPQLDKALATLPFPAVDRVVLGTLTIEFERTTLDEILRSAGVGSIMHRGDASDSEYWICFAESSAVLIWITSSPIAGPRHTVNGFIAEAYGSPKRGSVRCPELPAHLRPASVGNSIWVGSTAKQLRSWLGEPSARKDGWWLYFYSGKGPIDGFDETAVFGAGIVDAKIVRLLASKVTTN
jgi:hypothetical protein